MGGETPAPGPGAASDQRAWPQALLLPGRPCPLLYRQLHHLFRLNSGFCLLVEATHELRHSPRPLTAMPCANLYCGTLYITLKCCVPTSTTPVRWGSSWAGTASPLCTDCEAPCPYRCLIWSTEICRAGLDTRTCVLGGSDCITSTVLTEEVANPGEEEAQRRTAEVGGDRDLGVAPRSSSPCTTPIPAIFSPASSSSLFLGLFLFSGGQRLVGGRWLQDK